MMMVVVLAAVVIVPHLYQVSFPFLLLLLLPELHGEGVASVWGKMVQW